MSSGEKRQRRFVSLTRNPLFFLLCQTCLRLQSLLQMRAAWIVWRPAVWQMENCHRWRGVSTAAAVASGGEARDKDTPTVRAAQCITVITVMQDCWNTKSVITLTFWLHNTLLLHCSTFSPRQNILQPVVKCVTEIRPWNIIFFIHLHKSLDAIRFSCFNQVFFAGHVSKQQLEQFSAPTWFEYRTNLTIAGNK